jgi:hypothetical protein
MKSALEILMGTLGALYIGLLWLSTAILLYCAYLAFNDIQEAIEIIVGVLIFFLPVMLILKFSIKRLHQSYKQADN